MEINKKALGQRIHELRKSNNMSMAELAKKIHAGAKSTVNTWEKGETLPRPKYLKSLANVLGVSENYLKFGSLKTYLTNLILSDYMSDNSICGETIREYLGLKTDWYSFMNGIPLDPGTDKPVDPDNLENVQLQATLDMIKEIIDKNYSDISDFLKDDLQYNNDFSILQKVQAWFRGSSVKALNTFEGEYRLFRKGLEDHIPSSMGFENASIDEVKKRISNTGKSISDEEALDMVFTSKLSNWQMDALNSLSKLNSEYQSQLQKIHNKELASKVLKNLQKHKKD